MLQLHDLVIKEKNNRRNQQQQQVDSISLATCTFQFTTVTYPVC